VDIYKIKHILEAVLPAVELIRVRAYKVKGQKVKPGCMVMQRWGCPLAVLREITQTQVMLLALPLTVILLAQLLRLRMLPTVA
jgi:hypothetical protein